MGPLFPPVEISEREASILCHQSLVVQEFVHFSLTARSLPLRLSPKVAMTSVDTPSSRERRWACCASPAAPRRRSSKFLGHIFDRKSPYFAGISLVEFPLKTLSKSEMGPLFRRIYLLRVFNGNAILEKGVGDAGNRCKTRPRKFGAQLMYGRRRGAGDAQHANRRARSIRVRHEVVAIISESLRGNRKVSH